jgi:excisionase family DNA binding protein
MAKTPTSNADLRAFLTVAELAQATGMTAATVRSWIASGTLPAMRLGHSFLIPRSVYEMMLRAQFPVRGFR